MVKIIKYAPIPKSSGAGARSKYPWAKMEIGDSFIAECKSIAGIQAPRIRAEARYNKEFIARTTKNGIQVWRVK